jgi:hypothetical protein
MKILGPKFVKKANQWCVTVIIEETKDKKGSQKQEWFSSEYKAEEYILSLQENK